MLSRKNPALPQLLSRRLLMFPRIVASALIPLLLPILAQAQTQKYFKAIHNATEKQYQDWINGLDKDNMHPTHVSVYGSGAGLRFAALANNSFNGGWLARHDMTSEAYQ